MTHADRDLLGIAHQAALRARAYLRESYESGRVSVGGTGHDIKVAADRESEKRIVDFLRSESGLPIMTEETGWLGAGEWSSERSAWVLDPLDGSFNYNHGIPFAAVSIGLWENGKPRLGVVADVFRDELFEGGVGQGVRVNGTPAQVSRVSTLGEAVLCTGLPVGGRFNRESLERTVSEMQRFKKVRYLGSAALSLAYVACGRADVYREEGIRIWDVAAGLALVLGAGGSVAFEAFESDSTLLNVTASNRDLAQAMKGLA
jgi:myo-inositol-1(or 4)-monophosphatase